MSNLSHLTAFFNKSMHDNRLFPTHISLYVTLFQHWNHNKFNNPLGVVREEIMQQSKIGSKATYHKCMRDLQEFQYLTYQPSFSPYQSSTVHMIKLKEPIHKLSSSTKNEQVKKHTSSINEQVEKEVYIYNTNTKNNKNIFIDTAVPKMNRSNIKSGTKKSQTGGQKFVTPTIQKVKLFFEEVKSTKDEAERFYNYYSSNGWLVGGKSQMKNWEAAARNWILNSDKFRPKETSKHLKPDHLHVKTDKNYGEPL